MARVSWSRESLRNLDEIRTYIAQFDPSAARLIARRLIDAGDSLAVFPDRGRPVSGGRRELVAVRPYIIRYRVDPEQVSIIRIRHAARLQD